MTNKLQEICDKKREDIQEKKSKTSFSEIDTKAKEASPVRRFANAMRTKVEAGQIALIAEIKKASPSAGLIREDFDPASLAKAYEAGGATCLSVLTDEPYFQGKDEYLIQAREACALPVLRKDFIIDPWQVAESRALGADCVLLIVAALEEELLKELHATVASYGMNMILEVHNKQELEAALRLPSGLIGVNNRNLKTLETDLVTTEKLAPSIPEGREVVCESGIHTPADIARIRELGIHRFLVGESLMKQADVTKAVKDLIA